MIANKSIQDVLTIAQVEEVVGDFVNLKRRGANRIGLCPFHDEKTPSFIVSPAKNIYKCFGCGKGGNSVQFLMESESMSFVEAIRFLATKYNITLEESEENREEYEEQKKHTDSLFIVNDFARNYFKKQLFESAEGKTIGLGYFKERGYREDIIKKFDLGYAPKERNHFKDQAIYAKYDKQYLSELGLVSSRDQDFFNDRVMFTIHNLSGKPIAFAGRILVANKKAPKYINSPESEVYNKRKILYGIYQAKEAIRKADNCILVEGYTDVLSLHQNGVQNVVASSGTSLTKEQLRLVKRFTDNLTILYDGDQAGINAALRGLELALEADINVRIVILPENEDPDSFVFKAGHDGFNQYVEENQKDFILFKLDQAAQGALKDPIKKTEITRDIINTLSSIMDPIKRSNYIQQSSILLKFDELLLTKQVTKKIREKIKQKRIKEEREAFKETGHSIHDEEQFINEKPTSVPQKISDNTSGDAYQEKDIVRIIMNYGDQLENKEENITVTEYIYNYIVDVIEYFENPTFKRIVEIAMERIQNKESVNPAYFTNHSDPEIQSIAIELLSTPYSYANWASKDVYLVTQKMPELNFAKDSKQAIVRFKYRKVIKVKKEIGKKIEEISATEEKKDLEIYIKALMKLDQQRLEIANELGMVVV